MLKCYNFNSCNNKGKMINFIDKNMYCDICNLQKMNDYFKIDYDISDKHIFYSQYNYKKEYVYNFVNNEEFRDYFFRNCRYLRDYFKSDIYIKEQTKIMLSKIEKELIEKTCHPNRYFDWCLDIQEKYELN